LSRWLTRFGHAKHTSLATETGRTGVEFFRGNQIDLASYAIQKLFIFAQGCSEGIGRLSDFEPSDMLSLVERRFLLVGCESIRFLRSPPYELNFSFFSLVDFQKEGPRFVDFLL
jgi:hypothetical protein